MEFLSLCCGWIVLKRATLEEFDHLNKCAHLLASAKTERKVQYNVYSHTL